VQSTRKVEKQGREYRVNFTTLGVLCWSTVGIMELTQ